MRVEKTIKNIKVAMLYQITILLIGFIDRKLFLSVLGVNYLGLHGLFGNIITMLSLAELGVGTAIIYNLYKPLEDQNKEEVAALMQLYKKVYYVIGAAIGLLGIILMFFLPILIKEPMANMAYVRGVYLVFLAGTVLSYLTGYKRALLYADQKNYILLLGDMAGNTIGVIAKVITLVTLKNYMAYVVVHAGFKVLPNLWANYQVNKLYPYINKLKTSLAIEKLQEVKENIKDLFVHKIAHFVVTSTDSLIISSFIGISTVGYLANYNMIIGALMGFVAQGVEALQASMGNLVVSRSKEKVEEVYDRLTFASFWIGSFCAVALICLVQPFIKLWLGEEYFLQNPVVLIIIINFFLWILTRPLWQMMTVAGLFKEDKINAIVEITVNLVLSLLLVQKLGLIGVLIGTTISYLVAWIMKSHLLYRKFFKKSSAGYYGKIGVYSLITVVEVIVIYGISKKVDIANDYLRFMVQIIVCAVVPNLINYALFSKTKNFTYFKELIGDITMKIMEQLGTEQNKLIIQNIIFTVLAILIFFLPLERTMDPTWHMLGKVPALAIFGITNLYIIYLLLVPGIISEKAKKVIWIYAAGAIGLAVISFFRGGITGAKAAIMMALTLNVGLAMAHIDYKKIGKRIYILDIGVLTYIGTIAYNYMKLAEKPRSYYFIFNNPNYLGLIAVLLIFVCLLAYGISQEERYFIYPMALVPIINLSKGRTSMLALTVALVVFVLWKIIIKDKALYYTFFALVIGGLITVVMAYPLANSLAESKGWDQEKIATIGRKMYSNRETLWVDALEISKEKPILGYGMGATLESLTETDKDLSTHNIYMQLLLESGLAGILAFLGFLSWMWKSLWTVNRRKLVRAGASALVGILVIGVFELTLLGQSISLGIIQWLIIGMTLSPALTNKSKTIDTKEMD